MMNQERATSDLVNAPTEAALQFSRMDRQHAGRSDAEHIIRRRYWTEHRVQRCHFLDHLIVLHATRGRLRAALGISGPSSQAFFLESYLDKPVDQVIAAVGDSAPDRSRIVEIGNLVSHDSSAATALMMLTVAWLAGYGAEWGVFTATRTVRLRLRCLGVPLLHLGVADPARLGPMSAEWGRYYESAPNVVAARFDDARQLLRATHPEWADLAVYAHDDGARVRIESGASA